MPYSALRLGQTSARSWSRRRRVDSSYRLPVRLAVAIALAVTLVGSVGASIQARSSPLETPRLDQQRYLQAVWPIYLDLQTSTNRMGLAAALFENGDIDAAELQRRLEVALASYAQAGDGLRGLDPPAELLAVHQGYLDALGLFDQSALEMLEACDDGDASHIAAAVPLMLEGTAQLQALGNRFWPARVG